MSVNPQNPEALSEINDLKVTDELKNFTQNLARDIEQEKANRSTWESTVQKYVNLRYGIRSAKTLPWANCANYSLPLIDTHINAIKPSYVNLAFGVSVICSFIPYGPEDIEPARKREQLFDWRMKTRVKFFEPYNIAIDKMLECGASVMKTIWEFSTNTYTKEFDLNEMDEQTLQALYDPRLTDDILFKIIADSANVNLDFEENVKEVQKAIKKFREGKTKFRMTFTEIKENRARVVARSLLEDVVVPVDTLIYENNLDDARWIDDRMWVSVNELKISMRDEKYNEYGDSEIKAWANAANYYRKNNLIPSNTDDLILIHETCCWHDINGDGIKERCIVTWPDAKPSMILRFIELPYDHGQWPYTLIKRELNDPGAYSSRGVGSLDEDYQTGISTLFNQTVDNGTITNTPIVKYKTNAVSNIRNNRYIPGNPLELNAGASMDDYRIEQLTNVSQGAQLQLAQYLKAWADNRIGNISSGVSDPTNLSGAGQQGQKTAKEINLIEGLQGRVQSLDLQVFQQQMSRVYYQIDSLYEQFGDDGEYVQITGEQPVRYTRDEVRGKFHIVPNGTVDNSNPAQRAQKAFNLLRILAGDPDIRQYELKKIFLNDYDSRIAGKVLLTQQEVQQRNQMQMQQQQMMKQQALQENMQLRQISDMMDVQKADAMSVVQGKPYAPD